LNGAWLLILDKPPGMTSFQALDGAKRALATRRVGHTGTLDRFASGLLVALAGPATRLASLVEALDKDYRATIRFGEGTETLDPDSPVTSRGPVPLRAELERVLPEFVGQILQAPPAYSAVHVQGRRAHQLARAGLQPALAPRPVQISRLEVLEFSPPDAVVSISCGRGTYVRALARDLGIRLGTCAHLVALRRTRIGGFRVAEGHPPAELDLSRDLLPVRALFDRCPPLAALELAAPWRARVASGAAPRDDWFEAPPRSDGTFGLFEDGARLAAVAERRDGRWRVTAVFAGTASSGKGPAAGTASSGKGPAAGTASSGKGPAAGTASSGKGPAAGTASSGNGPAAGTASSGKGSAAG
jgi:tRNA pseudouridine55 synthase